MKNEYYYGTLRVTNPNTVKRYIQNGELKKLEDEGYEYQPGCGRFLKSSNMCTCHKCRKLLQQVNNISFLIKRHSNITSL